MRMPCMIPHVSVLGLVLAPAELVERAHALLEPLLARHPELLAVLHDVREHGAAEEDHVFPARRVLDADLEFLWARTM